MSIEIGAVIDAKEITKENIKIIKQAGFKKINIFFWESLYGLDLRKIADIMVEMDMPVSCLSIFGNPLRDDLKGDQIKDAWKTLIENSSYFSYPYISGFAGRICGKSVSDSIISWKNLFLDLLDYSYKKNSKGILFENCRMGDTWKTGKWNIAINPDAWQLMFNEINDEKLALQWEPCHQVAAFIDPINQLNNWISKIKHIHGKDGKIDYNLLKEKGFYGQQKVFTYTLPGKGDTSWQSIFQVLNRNNFEGNIDIEFQGESFISNISEAKKSLDYLIESKNKAL